MRPPPSPTLDTAAAPVGVMGLGVPQEPLWPGCWLLKAPQAWGAGLGSSPGLPAHWSGTQGKSFAGVVSPGLSRTSHPRGLPGGGRPSSFSPWGEAPLTPPFRFFPWPPALGQALSCPVLWAPGELGDLLLGAEQDEIDKHRRDSAVCCVPVVMEGWPEHSPGRRVGLLRKEAAAVQVEVRGEMVLWAEGQQERRPGGLKGQRTADPGEGVHSRSPGAGP